MFPTKIDENVRGCLSYAAVLSIKLQLCYDYLLGCSDNNIGTGLLEKVLLFLKKLKN